MNASNGASPLLALLAAALLAGCTDRGPITEPAQPGVLVATISTPHADDRALMLELAGAGITAVEAASSGYTLHVRSAGQLHRVAVFGDLQSGALLRFRVPDVRSRAAYTVRVLESGGPENALRSDLDGYRIEIGPLP
jgi:hypothetical protein